eukprot:2243565-Amphidinium_carterae.1
MLNDVAPSQVVIPIPSCHSPLLASMATHPKLSLPKSGINVNPSQVVIPPNWPQWQPIPSCHSHPKLSFQ